MTKSKKTLQPQPTRTYHIPGGPKAKNLGKTEQKILAEIKRGDSDDRGFGARRNNN